MPKRVAPSAKGVLAVAGTLLFAAGLSAVPPGQTQNWKFDVVLLRTGRTFQGLVLRETPGTVHFLCVRQRPGERTKLGPVTTFVRQEILRTEWLDDKERAILKSRLRELEPACEKERIAKIQLERVPWRGQPDRGFSYTSDYFVLISNAREEIVRRAAVRLEQIYEAYVRFLPPRRAGLRQRADTGVLAQSRSPRTQILLVSSTAEYRQLLCKPMADILNPAFYDPASNKIVCGSDLQELADELDRIHQECQQRRKLLQERQSALLKLPHPLPEALQDLAQQRTSLNRLERQNAEKFAKATEGLFQVLYHEAFHAYLAGFVYPPSGERDCATAPSVPRWLNEGLAQIFETAILEAGELRVGHADLERLKQVKGALRSHQLVPLTSLLTAEPARFLVGHGTSRQVSDAYYLTSWALAFHLMFAQRKLDTPELDDYIHAVSHAANPVKAFSKLVGEPLPAFEESFHRYLRMLQPDGSTGS